MEKRGAGRDLVRLHAYLAFVEPRHSSPYFPNIIFLQFQLMLTSGGERGGGRGEGRWWQVIADFVHVCKMQ